MNVVISKEEVKIYVEAYVESETKEGIFYRVICKGVDWECTCPDYVNRQKPWAGVCKHIKAVQDELGDSVELKRQTED